MRIAIYGCRFFGLKRCMASASKRTCEDCPLSILKEWRRGFRDCSGSCAPLCRRRGEAEDVLRVGIEAAKGLIAVAEGMLGEQIANRDGIIRYVVHEAQYQQFLTHSKKFKDVQQIGERCFLIESGMTVDCPRYLDGLWKAVEAKGARLISQEVTQFTILGRF